MRLYTSPATALALLATVGAVLAAQTPSAPSTQPASMRALDGAPAKSDPYFTPTEAKSTSYMPKVIIRNMREDRAGNIWFATFGGPIRYDGKEFTNFSEEVGLARTRIFSLVEDRSGALWFGSITGGASRYDGKSFTKFTVNEGLAGNDVTWIFEDRDGKIWLGTDNGVSRYDGKSMTNFSAMEGLVHNSVYAIAQDASGRIWFGTQGGVCSYDGKSFTNLGDQVGRTFVNIRSMVVDRSGNLWFGGQQGAFRYDGKTVAAFTSNEGLLDDFVGSMIIDRAGNIWLGHPGGFPNGQGGGASRYDGKSFKHFTQKEGLGSLPVYAMLEDKSGNIWFGSADAGASRYDGKSFTNFSATAAASAQKTTTPSAHDSSAPSTPVSSAPPTQPDGVRALDGEWIFVEDRTDGHTLEQLGPPMASKFSMRVEDGAVVLNGHGSGHKDVRIALDGSITEVKEPKTTSRYRGSWKDDTFEYKVEFVRAADNAPDGSIHSIRRSFRNTPDGLLVRVASEPVRGPEAVGLYRHAEDIALPAPAKAGIGDLAWLAGTWVATKAETGSSVEERWSPPLGGAMLATSRSVNKSGKMFAFEYLRIVERDGGLVYIAQPGGAKGTEFVLTELETGMVADPGKSAESGKDGDPGKSAETGKARAVFENPRHDYPKRIVYELSAEGGLSATIGFMKGGTPRRFEFKREK